GRSPDPAAAGRAHALGLASRHPGGRRAVRRVDARRGRNNGAGQLMDRTRQAVADMAREDPELAARLVLQTLPAAAAKIPGKLTYGLVVEGLGEYTVAIDSGRADVHEGLNGGTEFNLSTNVPGLAQLAAGTSPLRLIVSGRVRIRGNRLRARKLRAMSNGEIDLADVIANGGAVD